MRPWARCSRLDRAPSFPRNNATTVFPRGKYAPDSRDKRLYLCKAAFPVRISEKWTFSSISPRSPPPISINQCSNRADVAALPRADRHCFYRPVVGLTARDDAARHTGRIAEGAQRYRWTHRNRGGTPNRQRPAAAVAISGVGGLVPHRDRLAAMSLRQDYVHILRKIHFTGSIVVAGSRY